jgi:hypothetical protein
MNGARVKRIFRRPYSGSGCIDMWYMVLHYVMTSYSTLTNVQYDGHLPEELKFDDDGTISGRLGREPANVRTWKQAPHAALANLTLDRKSIERFMHSYGVFGTTVGYANGLRTVGGLTAIKPDIPHTAGRPAFSPSEYRNIGFDEAAEETFSLTVHDLVDVKNIIQLAWRKDHTAVEIIRQRLKIESFQFLLDRDDAIVKTHDLWATICLLFLMDRREGKIRICQNGGCLSPYFVSQRKDQAFCSHRCAVASNNARRSEQRKKRAK